MNVPLQNRPSFTTRDPDEARDVVSRAFCAHELDVLDGHLAMRTRSAALPRMSLHYLDYGAKVRISPDPLSSFYLLQVPLTVEDIAEAVGASVRALQSGFRRHVGSSPLTYLRDVRLELVHEALREADPSRGPSVTDLALAHGFTHLGRFAQAYRERFGVAPSDTLRT